MNMNIEELTIKQMKEIKAMLDNGCPNTHPYKVGQNYFIRTVTFYFTGELVSVGEQELVLRNAAWIADTGRFMDAIKTGTLNEVEPFPDGEEVIVGRAAIIDAVRWSHPLPRAQK
jgi:hypothetical protein